MADVAVVPVAPEVAAPVVDAEPTDVQDALRIVLRKAHEANGLVRGLSEVARALDRKAAHLAVLAEDCDDESYKTLIKALCAQQNIDIVTVGERAKLAEWAGLQKFDAQGNVKKTFKCSVVAVKEFGERTRALDMLLKQLE